MTEALPGLPRRGRLVDLINRIEVWLTDGRDHQHARIFNMLHEKGGSSALFYNFCKTAYVVVMPESVVPRAAPHTTVAIAQSEVTKKKKGNKSESVFGYDTEDSFIDDDDDVCCVLSA